MRHANSHRKQTVEVTQAADTDWRAVELSLLGLNGVLSHLSVRLEAGGTNGVLEVKVIDGAYPDPASMSSADIAAVPDDDVVYHETGISLVNSATTSTKTNIIASVGESAVYDRRGGNGYSAEDRSVMLAYKGDGTLAGTIYAVIRAINVGR